LKKNFLLSKIIFIFFFFIICSCGKRTDIEPVKDFKKINFDDEFDDEK
jgi:thioredoxin-related protein